MSNFTTKRDAVEAWFSNGFHALWTAILPVAKEAAPAVEEGLATIATAAVRSGVSAQGQGLSGKDIADAALKGAQSQLSTVGVEVGTTELNALAVAVETHLTNGITVGAAPAPPA